MKKSQLKQLIREIISELNSETPDDKNARTEHFWVKFGEPGLSKGAAKIFLGDEWFANTYRITEGFGGYKQIKDGEWVVNAHEGAWRLKYSSPPESFPTVQDLLNHLEEWYQKKTG